MKIQTTLAIAALLIIVSCNSNHEQSPLSFAPKVVAAHGYIVPKDSMAEPKVTPAGRPRVVPAGKPKVVLTNTNVHPAGIPRVEIAGVPRVCTPGHDSFSLPKTVPAIDSPFMAGIPEVENTRDQNPQNFSSFGKLQGDESRCLLEDKSGNLWFGTSDGVIKYDGKSFTHFNVKEGLSHNLIRSLWQDKSGSLWVGTEGLGVNRYDGNKFTHFTVKEGLSDNTVYSIYEGKSGNMWFGTAGGVSKYDGKRFTNFTIKEGLSNNRVLSIGEDKNGNLWFGTEGGGVNRYDAKSFTHFTVKEGLSDNNVLSIYKDNNGDLWFGTAGGVSKYDGKRFTNFTVKEGLSNNRVLSIGEDKNGNLWFGTEGGGVNRYDRKSFTHFNEKEGLSSNVVWSILKDKRGNLWFSTIGGVNRYYGSSFSHFPAKEEVSGSILEDKKGNLCFSTGGGGVGIYNGNRFTYFAEKEGPIANGLASIAKDKIGNLWFSSYEGVIEYDGGSFTHFTSKEGLDNAVVSILEDKRGNIWFGTYLRGVIEYDGRNFTHFTEKEGLSHNIVPSIQEDKSGNLWFGSYGGGLSRYDVKSKSFTHFTQKEGLSDNFVQSLLEDKSGNLWIGTAYGGVSKYDGGSFTHFTEKEGLSGNSVYSIIEDTSGNLWFGTNHGLSKLGKNNLATFNKARADEAASGLIKSEPLLKTYTSEDGCSGVGTMCEAKDGTIWIASGDGLTAFHPGEENPDTIAPNIQLTGLTLFNENIGWQNLLSPSGGRGRSPDNYREAVKDTAIILGNGVRVHNFHFDGVSRWYGIPEHLSLAYNNNYLTFQFVGITIQSPKKVKYQYKLEGLDENWSALTNRSEATYGNLPHGKYTFKVKAMNGDGYWSKEFNYSFTIQPPWWYTWWAYCLYGLLILAAVVATHRYQKQRIIRIEQEKAQKKELEHAKEIEKAYNELQATQAQLVQREKMASLGELTAGIAHEIQNPLNFVNNFSEVNKELLLEMKDEMNKGNLDDANSIANDVIDNQEKINHHGKRADAIVKGMLQHSRSGTGQKEPTNINALADDYLKLAYHGMKAKDKSFNATLQIDFDASIGTISIIPQDIGRVLLNLYNNAFYAVTEKSKHQLENYQPTVSVTTKRIGDKMEIKVKDNGDGIPQKVVDKIFQPFFTTKPTGQGTGLGLSLSYDIIKAHGGELKVQTNDNNGACFVITLPV